MAKTVPVKICTRCGGKHRNSVCQCGGRMVAQDSAEGKAAVRPIISRRKTTAGINRETECTRTLQYMGMRPRTKQ